MTHLDLPRSVEIPVYHRSNSWRRVALSLLSFVFAIAFASSIITLLSPPQLTLWLSVPASGDAYVTWIVPGGNLWEQGVRPGDRVLTIDGRRPHPTDSGSWAGHDVVIRTAPDAVDAFNASMIRREHKTWPALLISPWFFLLGVLVLIRGPTATIRRAAMLLFGSAALALALAPLAVHDHPIGAAAEHVMLSLFGPCFLLFFLSFPTHHSTRTVRTLLFVPAFCVTMLSLVTYVQPSLYPTAWTLRLICLLVYIVLGISVAIHASIVSSEPGTKQGLSIVGVGTVLAVFPFVGFYVLPVLLGAAPILAPEYAIVALVLLPLSFAHAILRHQVLRIPLIQRWLVRGLGWIVLLGLLTSVVYLRHQLIDWMPEPVKSIVLAGVAMGFLAITYGALGRCIRLRIEQRIFKDIYDYRSALRTLSYELSRMDDLSTVGSVVPSTLRRMMNLDVVLLIVTGDGVSHVCGADGSVDQQMEASVTAAASQVQTAVETVALPFGSVLFVPLRTHGTIIGHLCLGPKSNGEPFRAEDDDLVATLSGQVAAVVHASQLISDLRSHNVELDLLNKRLQRAQEEERARLAADLHDEPLQTAIYLRRQLTLKDGAATVPGPADPAELSAVLVTQLRDVCARIRPPILDDLGLFAALDNLVEEQSVRFGIPILLHVDGDAFDHQLPTTVALVLYRAAQEATANAIRHASAQRIQLDVNQRNKSLHLVITDDGRGFEVPR